MLFLKVKDLKYRNSLRKKELYVLIEKVVNIKTLNKTFYKLPSLDSRTKNFSKTKLVRRCVFNNRSRGVTRPYNISRIKFRELLQFGLIPGYKKSVW